MKLVVCLYAIVALFWAGVNSLYFHIKETETKCFIEEVPDDTLVAGTYKLLVLMDNKFVHSPNIAMHVEVHDPQQKKMLSRMYVSEGRFTFTTHGPGEYKICLSSNSTAWFGGSLLRVHLDIAVGDHALDYADIAKKDKLNDLQLRVRQLLDQVQSIAKDQNFQRVREEHFRQLSESTNQRVTWWSIGQLGLLIVIGFWQMRHLRAFFQAKKLA